MSHLRDMAASQEHRSNERERAVLDRQLNGLPSEDKEKSKRNVLTYATASDKVILSVSSVCAVFAGALNPLVPVSTTSTLPIRIQSPNLTYVGNLRPVGCCIQWLRSRHRQRRGAALQNFHLQFVLCLSQHRSLRLHVHCDGGILLFRGAHNSGLTNSIPIGYFATKHRLFRSPWSGRGD